MSKFHILKQRVIKCGNLSGTVQPVVEWVPNPYWGTFETRTEAKVAWCGEMFLDNLSVEASVREFDVQARSLMPSARVARIPKETA